MPWPFRRKTIARSIASKEEKNRKMLEAEEKRLRKMGPEKVAIQQQQKQIGEVRAMLKMGGVRAFNKDLDVKMNGRDVVVRATDKVADEMQEKEFTLDELKKNLMNNQVAKDDLTASTQVDWILKHPGSSFTSSEGMILVPVGKDANEKIRYRIKWKQLPPNY
jgi:HSP20 family molecular chaperone IbpA